MEKVLEYNKTLNNGFETYNSINQLRRKRNSRYAVQIALEEQKREKSERIIEAVKGFGIGFGSMALIVAACFAII